MKIIIDGDACCVMNTIERVSKKKNIECHVYFDTQHIINPDYAIPHIVDKGDNSADLKIANACSENDIVVTNDAGLAAMVLARKGMVLNSRGIEYTPNNIMLYLSKRHLRSSEMRRSKRLQVNGLSTSKVQHNSFETELRRLIEKGNEE